MAAQTLVSFLHQLNRKDVILKRLFHVSTEIPDISLILTATGKTAETNQTSPQRQTSFRRSLNFSVP